MVVEAVEQECKDLHRLSVILPENQLEVVAMGNRKSQKVHNTTDFIHLTGQLETRT